jgi:hypothetical protein
MVGVFECDARRQPFAAQRSANSPRFGGVFGGR